MSSYIFLHFIQFSVCNFFWSEYTHESPHTSIVEYTEPLSISLGYFQTLLCITKITSTALVDSLFTFHDILVWCTLFYKLLLFWGVTVSTFGPLSPCIRYSTQRRETLNNLHSLGDSVYV